MNVLLLSFLLLNSTALPPFALTCQFCIILQGATDVTLVGLGILGSILVLASIFWIFLRNRKRTSSPLSKDDREKDRSPSNASKAKDNKDRLPPKSRRAKNERVRDPPKTFEMVAKK